MHAPVGRDRHAARLSRPVLAVLVVAAGLGLAACDKTIRGAGQDIQDTGNAVSDAAN